MLSKKDIVILATVLALAGVLLLASSLLRPQSSADAPLVLRYSINGESAVEVPLTDKRELTIDQGDGVVNVLGLTPNGFSMLSSTCHNQLCVHQGEVSLENMDERPLLHMVVCAPHRLVAELIVSGQN